MLEKNICDIIMPDITRCGGPGEMKRIATMAEAYKVLVAPHNPNGPLSTHPVGRIGTPEEAGALCAFLASPHGAFISGSPASAAFSHCIKQVFTQS